MQVLDWIRFNQPLWKRRLFIENPNTFAAFPQLGFRKRQILLNYRYHPRRAPDKKAVSLPYSQPWRLTHFFQGTSLTLWWSFYTLISRIKIIEGFKNSFNVKKKYLGNIFFCDYSYTVSYLVGNPFSRGFFYGLVFLYALVIFFSLSMKEVVSI